MSIRRFRKSIILCVILLITSISLCSCSYFKLQLPEQKKPPLEKYTWANDARSLYYYNQLDEKLQAPYQAVVEACLSLNEVVDVDRLSGEEISKVMQAVIRDYPGIMWLDYSYSYKKSLIGTTLKLKYTMTENQVNTMLTQLNQATNSFLEDISPNLPDDEKVQRIHDKLVQTVVYDSENENQRNVYGAIVEHRATCEGYARAMQFLLLKVGIESTVVYGEANEPHAWNLVRLGADYYWVDATFDDLELKNGGTFLSREYLLITDDILSRTHTIATDGSNWALPKCDKTEYNYFVKHGTLVKNSNVKEVQKLVRAEAKKAIQERAEAFQIRFETKDIADVVEESALKNGFLDNAIYLETSKYQGVEYIGRTYEPKTYVATFLLKYD